jgi:hypothetical protein
MYSRHGYNCQVGFLSNNPFIFIIFSLPRKFYKSFIVAEKLNYYTSSIFLGEVSLLLFLNSSFIFILAAREKKKHLRLFAFLTYNSCPNNLHVIH